MKNFKIALLIVLFPIAFTLAQDMPDGEGLKRLEKIEQMENAKIIQILNLSEENAVRFFARRKEFRQQQRDLLEKRHKIIESVDDQLNSSDKDNQAKYKEKLEELISIEVKLTKEKKDFYKSVGTILSPKQLMQLALFEDKFRREMRETLIKRRQQQQ